MIDLLIIGSGPAGLAAAIYARRANLETVVAEKIYGGTGQVAESSQVDNYPGLPETNGYDLGQKFREHAESLGTEFKDGEAVAFSREGDSWQTTFKNEEVIASKAVIYAAGAVHRHLNIPGENELAGRGVSYCATCDGAFFRNRTVAVIGGGDTALDDALYLADICSKVYLIHRREEFRGSGRTVARLSQKENVEFVLKAKPGQIEGEDKVTGLKLEDGRTLAVDGVFIAVGMVPVTEPVKDVVKLDENGYIIAGETGKTSAEGFYVAGDARTKALRQVVTAVSDGANAATAAELYIRTCFG